MGTVRWSSAELLGPLAGWPAMAAADGVATPDTAVGCGDATAGWLDAKAEAVLVVLAAAAAIAAAAAVAAAEDDDGSPADDDNSWESAGFAAPELAAVAASNDDDDDDDEDEDEDDACFAGTLLAGSRKRTVGDTGRCGLV